MKNFISIKPYTALMILVWLISAWLVYLNLWRYPAGNGRDEIDHLRVIHFYVNEHHFPVLPDDWAAASVEAHQPPLYYALMTVLIRLGLPEPQNVDSYRVNPFLVYGNYDPNIPPYNRVLYVQSNQDNIVRFRWMRVVGILIHLVGIGFVWKTVGELFASNRWIAPLTLAFLMITPAYWRTAMVVNNNQLVFLFGAVATWLLARMLCRGLDWWLSAALGITLGLGMLSKLFMLPLVMATPLVLLFIPFNAYRLKSRNPAGDTYLRAFKHLILIGALTALIAGWWYWRNYQLYGDFTAANVTEDILQSRRTEPFTAGDAVEVVTTWVSRLWLESWLVLNTTPSKTLADIIGGVLILSSLTAFRFLRQSYVLLVGIFLAALLLALIAASRNQHGLYSPPIMLAGLPAISILFACGVVGWLPERLHPQAAISTVMIIITGTILFHVTSFLPLFPPLHRVDDAAKLDVENHVSIDFENGVRLVGYELTDKWLTPGEQTWVKLCWQATRSIETDYAFTLKFLLPDLPTAALTDGYPLSGAYPTSAWQPGTAFCEQIPMRVSADVVMPRAYDVFVGLYVIDGSDVKHITANGERSNYLVVDKIGVMAVPDGDIPPTQVTIDTWGGLDDEAHLADGQFQLTLYWVGRGTAPARFQYFLHALDESGNILAQLDRAPLDGGLPTDYWLPRMQFTDSLRLDIPPETAALTFGMYDPVTGQRGIWTQNGESVGDSLIFNIP